jgi:hypothetical protein
MKAKRAQRIASKISNLQSLNETIEKVVQERGGALHPSRATTSAQQSPTEKTIKTVEKPKKGRGAPKKPLIDTMRLLTG